MQDRVFGRLTVVGPAPEKVIGRPRWRCRCVCGQEKVTDGCSLRRGLVKSCGCLRRECSTALGLRNASGGVAVNRIDETGKAYGFWTVLGPGQKVGRHLRWRCRCVCGQEKELMGQSLRRHRTRSCGCRRDEVGGQPGRPKGGGGCGQRKAAVGSVERAVEGAAEWEHEAGNRARAERATKTRQRAAAVGAASAAAELPMEAPARPEVGDMDRAGWVRTLADMKKGAMRWSELAEMMAEQGVTRAEVEEFLNRG